MSNSYNLIEQTGALPSGWRGLIGFVEEVVSEFSEFGVGWVGVAMVLTPVLKQMGENAMSLYQAVVNRWVIPVIERHKEEGRAEGRTEGMAQAHDQWAAWNRRRLEAERQDRNFNEPPPAG